MGHHTRDPQKHALSGARRRRAGRAIRALKRQPGRHYTARDVELIGEACFDTAVASAWGVSTSTCGCFQVWRPSPWDRDGLRFAVRLPDNIVQAAPGPPPLPVAA
jgi:hypothetical protein